MLFDGSQIDQIDKTEPQKSIWPISQRRWLSWEPTSGRHTDYVSFIRLNSL